MPHCPRRTPKTGCGCGCPKPVINCSQVACWPQDDRDTVLLVCDRDDGSGLVSCPWMAAYQSLTPLDLGPIPWNPDPAIGGEITVVTPGPVDFNARFLQPQCDPAPDLECDVLVSMSNIRTKITWPPTDLINPQPGDQHRFTIEVTADFSWTPIDCAGTPAPPASSVTDYVIYDSSVGVSSAPTDCFEPGQAQAVAELYNYSILCNEGVISGGIRGTENACGVNPYYVKYFVIPDDAVTGSCESSEYEVIEWSVSDNTDEAWIIEDCSGNVTRTDLNISTDKSGYYRRVGDSCCVYLHAKNECGEVQQECHCDPTVASGQASPPPNTIRIVNPPAPKSELDTWPKWAQILAKCRIEGEHGPGDTFTRFQGEDWDRMARWARRHDIRRYCPTSKRRWNAVMRYSQLDRTRSAES